MPDPVTGIMSASMVAGGAANIFGAKSAAGKIGDAANSANAMMDMRWQKGIDLLREFLGKGKEAVQPYMDMGEASAGKLTAGMDDFTAPVMMDQETLEKTPGYEFLKTQGMRAVTGQNVLRGLSGAQVKGSADFVKGLADTTYKTQWDIANQNKTNAFNRLFTTSEAGRAAGTSFLNASATAGGNALSSATSTGTAMGGNLMTAGNAAAGADIATGQQIGSMISGMPYMPFAANKLYPNGFGGGSSGTPGAGGMYQVIGYDGAGNPNYGRA